MAANQWKTGRERAGLTQVAAACSLDVSQPYLSQLERGLRKPSAELAHKAAQLYGLPSALPLPEPLDTPGVPPNELERKLASLAYPGFEHVRHSAVSNPAEVVLSAVLEHDLDTRLVEALPWVLSTYTDLNWQWLQTRAKLHNAQNRLGYLVHLAGQTAMATPENAVSVLSGWENELEEARLAREGTLCRDSMPEPERNWLRSNRPDAAVHWNLLTGLTAEQLPYAAQ